MVCLKTEFFSYITAVPFPPILLPETEIRLFGLLLFDIDTRRHILYISQKVKELLKNISC